MAGTAFNMTGTAAIHALSFILSEEWGVSHGVACAFTLEDVFKLNITNEKTKQRLEKIAMALFGKEDTDALLDKIITLKKKFGLPFKFSDLNIEIDEKRIGELFEKTLDDPKMKNNIVPVDKDIVFKLIKGKI